MLEFTTKHIAKYRLKSNPNYVYSNDNICYNIKTGRVIKQILKGSSIVYTISGKFKSLDKLRKDLELIPKIKYCPFSNNTLKI